MYGLIGQLITAEGSRDQVVAALLEGSRDMPGCLSYVVALDSADPNAVWITEIWVDEKSHAASLEIPAVRNAIQRARPHIAGFGARYVTAPVGGQGVGTLE